MLDKLLDTIAKWLAFLAAFLAGRVVEKAEQNVIRLEAERDAALAKADLAMLDGPEFDERMRAQRDRLPRPTRVSD